MTSTLTQASRAVIGDEGQRVDLVIVALLVFLLIEYDMFRVYLPQAASELLKPLGLALVPLAIAFAIVIASRWWELR